MLGFDAAIMWHLLTQIKMMALFGPLAMVDDFCPRLSSLTVIPAPINSAEDGECPIIFNKKPSSVVSLRNSILSTSRSVDPETVNQGNECMTAQSTILSNNQDFPPPMVENSSSDEKGNVNVVQLSPPLAHGEGNPSSMVVNQEHNFPRSPVLLDESMSPIEMHNEPTSVSVIVISSNSNKEAEEKGSEDTPGKNQITTAESVDGGISALEQSIAGVQGDDRYLHSTTLKSYSHSPISRTRRGRKGRRRNTEQVGRESNEVFSFGSYGDLEPNFGTGVSKYISGRDVKPDLGATQRVSEVSSVDSRATMVSALPSPLLCPVLSPEVTSLAGPRQQGCFPRRASLVARESINLSLQALYTPMKFGSDRAFCFDLDAGNASQVVIEETGETAITSERKIRNQKRNRLSSQMSGSEVSPGLWKKRRRWPLTGNESSCNSTHPEVV
ncbi:hypothetical protein TSMEX_001082 [Taenia solium]|eukprot:TsM_001128500 transcript=TsM_001128500 gene=TsM_001128500